MKNVLSPKIGLQYLYIFIMISLTFQISGQFPILQRHYIFWLVGFWLAIYYSSRYLSLLVSFAAYAYLFIVWLNYLWGDYYFSNVMKCIEETVCFIVPITMLYYLFSRNDKRLFLGIIFVFSILLIENTIISFWANSLFPGIMRLQSNKESIIVNEVILAPFRKLGLSSYSLPHALPIIIPALICAVKQSVVKEKIFFIIILISSLVLIYVSGSTTALLMGGLVFILSILVSSNINNRVNVSIFISLLIIPFIFSQDLQLWAIRLIQSLVPDDSRFAYKLVDMEYSILYENAEGAVGTRMEKYNLSLEGFYSNPIIGTNGEIGGHAAFIDRLATLGVLGISPLLPFLYYQIRYTLRYITKDKRVHYFIGITAGLIMMSTKAFFGWEMWFLMIVILPGILWWKNSLNIND